MEVSGNKVLDVVRALLWCSLCQSVLTFPPFYNSGMHCDGNS